MTKEKLTQEQLVAKAAELSKKYNCEVQPLVFEKNDEQIVGYIKTPSRMVKARALDKAVTGTLTAAGELFEAILIVDESDSRFSSNKSEDDDIFFGGALAAFATIEIAVNQFKKTKGRENN